MDRSSSNTNRVMLWSVGRSLSGVFVKCMSYVEGIQILSEPYVAAYQLGPERIATADVHQSDASAVFNNYKSGANTIYETNLKMAVDDNVCTFDWAKEALEADYPGKNIVFCKDIPFAIAEKYYKLPTGFRHTYLIRHPHKVWVSWKKFAAQLLEIPYESLTLSDVHHSILPRKRSYGELHDLTMFLTATTYSGILIRYYVNIARRWEYRMIRACCNGHLELKPLTTGLAQRLILLVV